ncbi:MAG: endonuclease III [Candidatus Bathyarchaeia archaeon]
MAAKSDLVEKMAKIIEILRREYGSVRTILRLEDPLRTLISTILSAQCTDKKVYAVTTDLFKRYRTIQDYAKADLKELQKIIRPTGLYRNKAKNIKRAAQIIIENFKSKVPTSMEGLLSLPGVGRKTANIVLSHSFGIDEGIAVDTHVKRISKRLGLTSSSNPEKIEKDLMAIIPREDWGSINHLFITLGRKICGAKNPYCDKCPIIDLCPSALRKG